MFLSATSKIFFGKFCRIIIYYNFDTSANLTTYIDDSIDEVYENLSAISVDIYNKIDYVSATVDNNAVAFQNLVEYVSGDLTSQIFNTSSFLQNEIDIYKGQEIELLKEMLYRVEGMINATDFSKLYSKERKIFSIGFNIEENKLTDSYYDLLASEARQASLIAIAKKDPFLNMYNDIKEIQKFIL